MKKRVVSTVLALVMVLGLISWGVVPVKAAISLYWPVPGHTRLSQGFHDSRAIDISDANITGATVIAAIGGTVDRVFNCSRNHYGDKSCTACYGYGTAVSIKGTDGRIYMYAHMQAGSVPSGIYSGASVSACQSLGKVGNTGNSSGAHLHFGISVNTIFDKSGNINPENETYIYSSEPVDTPQVDSSYPTPFSANTLLWWNTSDGRTPVYDAINGNQLGYIYNGYNNEDDIVTVEEVYTNGWCKVIVPGLSAPRYCELSVFINVIGGYSVWTVTAPEWAQAYRRWDHGSPAGYVDAGDYIYIVSETDKMYQVVYPTSSGNCCRWVDRCSIRHTYAATVTNPTCTDQGYTTYTCSICGDSYKDNYSNAAGHSYTYKKTERPTVKAEGTLTGTCSGCGETITITLPKLNTTDYTFEVMIAPSCTAKGIGRYTWNTTTYGTYYFDVTIKNTDHSYSYAATKAPTVSDTGTLIGTCSNCSGTTTVTLPKLNTTDYSYKVVTTATCTANGTGRYTWKTTTYGSYYFDITIAKTGHSYSYKVTKAPTTGATGTLTGTCAKCSGTATVTLPKLSTTDYTYKVVTAATCTANGTGRYTWKTTTYGSYYFDVTIAKTGHSYSYKVTKAPTTGATGTLTGTCSKCSGTTTVTLPKLNTTDYTYKVVTAATCTANGTGRYTWKITTYGSYYFDITIAKTGHSYSYKVTKAPTTSATGTLTGTCSKCSGTTTVMLPRLNTADYTYTVTKEPSYTETGIGRYTWKTTSYGTYSFEVTLPKMTATLTKVEIASLPAKLVYQIGESLDTTGLKLKLIYTDGPTKTVSSGFATSILDSSTAGTKTVTVTYEGMQTSFTVTVKAAEIDEHAPQIVVESKTATAGDTVTVAVKIKNNPGFAGMVYDVFFDHSALELVSYELGLGEGICVASPMNKFTGKMNFQYAGMANIPGDGTLVCFTFRIKDTAPVGCLAEIRIVPEEGTTFRYEGQTEIDFDLAPVNGGVKIVDYLKGDINGDGSVNNRDAVRLMQYLAGWDVDYVAPALDVNGDGSINNRDAARLLQYLAGWDVEIH